MVTEKGTKKTSTRNIYWTDELERNVQKVADLLTKGGIRGLYLSNGEVNRTAVIRYLVDTALRESTTKNS